MANDQNPADVIIAMERAALDRWGQGDPSGFLEISAHDVVYFDPYQEMRLDGKEALVEFYESIRGKVHLDRFELLNPCVQLGRELAVLTFNYVSYRGEGQTRWNCTEVYRKIKGGWEIIQSHWSYPRHPGIVSD